MKKSFLSLAIASLLISACSEENAAETKKAVEKTADQAIEKVEKTAENVTEAVKKEVNNLVSDVDKATRAENSFKSLTTAFKNYYQKAFATQPIVTAFNYNFVSYEKGEHTSTAVTEADVKLMTKIEGRDHYTMTFNHTIHHDETIVDEGNIAKIVSTINVPEEAPKEYKKLIANFNIVTLIKQDESFEQVATLKPVDFTENVENTTTNADNSETLEQVEKPVETNKNGNKIAINGFSVTTKSTINDIEKGFSEFDGQFDGLKIVDNNFPTISVEPFEFNGFYKPTYKYKFTTTPITYLSPNFDINVAKIVSQGTFEMKPELGIVVGVQDTVAENVDVSNKYLPSPIKLKTLTFKNDVTLNADKDMAKLTSLQLVPEGDAFKLLTQGKLNVKQADLSFAIKHVPAKVIKQYQEMSRDIFKAGQELERDNAVEASADNTTTKEIEEIVNTKSEKMFNALKNKGAEANFKLNVQVDEGNILVNANTQMQKDSTVTFSELKGLKDTNKLFQLLNINADASIPAKLLETIAGNNIMMPSMFFKKDGDFYKSKVTTEDGKLLINGMPSPFLNAMLN